jgi:hypothetical protein
LLFEVCGFPGYLLSKSDRRVILYRDRGEGNIPVMTVEKKMSLALNYLRINLRETIRMLLLKV